MISRQDAALQDLIEDSITRILEHEDPKQYLKWVRSAFPTYDLAPMELRLDETTQRMMAMSIGRAIWNATPLPGNGFRPRPLPRPGRNDRCPCESGKKYKRCCRPTSDIPDQEIDTETILPLVLSLASPRQRSAMVASRHLPMRALIDSANQLLEDGHPRKALLYLEPIFAESIERPRPEHRHALHVLCQIYDDLGHNRKQLALLERVAAAPTPSVLRGNARLGLSDRRLAAGDVRGAREAWSLAKQDDLNLPGMGVCEIKLLVAEDRPEDALQRAAFWDKRLAERTNTGLERRLIDRLVESLRGVPGADAAIERLEDWFEDVRARPIPRYAIASDSDAEDALSLADRLRQMGLDNDQIRQGIESFGTSKAKNEPRGELLSEPLSEPEDDAPMHELLPPREVAALEREWRAIFPDSKPFATQDQPMGESRASEPAHVEAWLGFLEANTAAADSLDILDDLATLVSAGDESDDLLFALVNRAATILERVMAHAPAADLPWVIASNRPGLRSLVRLLERYTLEDNDDEALDVARLLLRINPDDNHGIRTFLMNATLQIGDDAAALALVARYPDDFLGDMLFGRALALIRTEDFAAAEETLRNRFARESKIPEFLIRPRAPRPEQSAYGTALGGPEEAWCYRQEMRDVWKQTAGALEWLTKTVARIAREVERIEEDGGSREASQDGGSPAE